MTSQQEQQMSKHVGNTGDPEEWLNTHGLSYRLHENHADCQNSLTVECVAVEGTRFKQGLLGKTSIKDGWDIGLQ